MFIPESRVSKDTGWFVNNGKGPSGKPTAPNFLQKYQIRGISSCTA